MNGGYIFLVTYVTGYLLCLRPMAWRMARAAIKDAPNLHIGQEPKPSALNGEEWGVTALLNLLWPVLALWWTVTHLPGLRLGYRLVRWYVFHEHLPREVRKAQRLKALTADIRTAEARLAEVNAELRGLGIGTGDEG